MSNLPTITHDPMDYTVGLFLSRNRYRWVVKLRLPTGGTVEIAHYRTQFFARRLINRSWRIAQ
jgi:hypothetical protein